MQRPLNFKGNLKDTFSKYGEPDQKDKVISIMESISLLRQYEILENMI